MIALSAHTKVYLAKDATDMRKSFRGLILLTETVLRQEPGSGHLFVFLNRRRDLMKILYWDGTGFCIWYKRLERGSFQRPPAVVGEFHGRGDHHHASLHARFARSRTSLLSHSGQIGKAQNPLRRVAVGSAAER